MLLSLLLLVSAFHNFAARLSRYRSGQILYPRHLSRLAALSQQEHIMITYALQYCLWALTGRQKDVPDVEAPAQGESQGRQSFRHAGDSICAVGVIPVKGLQHYMRPRQGYAEMLWVHDYKVAEELLHLQTAKL